MIISLQKCAPKGFHQRKHKKVNVKADHRQLNTTHTKHIRFKVVFGDEIIRSQTKQ